MKLPTSQLRCCIKKCTARPFALAITLSGVLYQLVCTLGSKVQKALFIDGEGKPMTLTGEAAGREGEEKEEDDEEEEEQEEEEKKRKRGNRKKRRKRR